MEHNYFTMLENALNKYDGDSAVLRIANEFITNALKVTYGLIHIPRKALLAYNKEHLTHIDNPFVPIVSALLARSKTGLTTKLNAGFNELPKYKTHPLYNFAMGVSYIYSYGTKKDDNTAFDYFKAGEKLNCPLSTLYLARFFAYSKEATRRKQDINDAVRYFEKASKAGISQATVELAHLVSNQEIKKLSTPVTISLIKRLSKQTGEPFEKELANFAHVTYEQLSKRGKGGRRKEREYWLKLAYKYKANNAPLLYYFFLKEFADDDKDALPLATEYLIESAQSGNAIAQFELGNFYLTGNYLPQNSNLALKHFKESADLGLARAYLFVASLYATNSEFNGDEQTIEKYVTKEYQRIIIELDKKRRASFPMQINNFQLNSREALKGFLYFELANIISLSNNFPAANKYYLKALDFKFTAATYTALGNLHMRHAENYQDTTKLGKAFNYYKQGVENADPYAYRALAKCYALGISTARDEAHSEQLLNMFITATKHNEIETLIKFYDSVSYEFERGKLVQRDFTLANYYLEKLESLHKN